MNEDRTRQAAIERLNNRRAFGQHLVTFVVVNLFVVGIWAATGAGYFWPIWLIGFWGIGLVLHAWTTFVQRPITEADVQREIERGSSTVS
jgi:hypothetical protein